MPRYTLLRDGELVGVSSSDESALTFMHFGYNLENEGQRVTLKDRSAWVEKRAAQILSIHPKKDRFKTTNGYSKAQWAKARTEARKKAELPKIGTFKSLADSPALARWLEQYGRLFPTSKRGLIMRRLWQLLTGSSSGKEACTMRGSSVAFKQVLAVILTSDPDEFAKSVFNMSLADAAKLDSVHVPQVLLPIFDVCTKVDGRGEILAAFMFNDVAWLPGTGKFDLEGEGASAGNWHVKETKSLRSRMGSNSYAVSDVRARISKLMKDGKLTMTGRCNPMHDISKEFIEMNRKVLDEAFKPENGFSDAMNRAFQLSESNTRGTIFFRSGRAFVRFMPSIECIGATKGDFIVSPSAFPQRTS